jgi:hypothetical protein
LKCRFQVCSVPGELFLEINVTAIDVDTVIILARQTVREDGKGVTSVGIGEIEFSCRISPL